MRILGIVLSVAMLSGCLAMAKLFGYDWNDPEQTLVIIQAKGVASDLVQFRSLDGEKPRSLLEAGYLNGDCQVFASPVPRGKYELESLSYNSANRAFYTYEFQEGSPAAIRFEAKPGEVIYLGTYQVSDGGEKKTFNFGKTSSCGDAKSAMQLFQKEFIEGYTFMRSTPWPARVSAWLEKNK